jgi:hypothetical protein
VVSEQLDGVVTLARHKPLPNARITTSAKWQSDQDADGLRPVTFTGNYNQSPSGSITKRGKIRYKGGREFSYKTGDTTQQACDRSNDGNRSNGEPSCGRGKKRVSHSGQPPQGNGTAAPKRPRRSRVASQPPQGNGTAAPKRPRRSRVASQPRQPVFSLEATSSTPEREAQPAGGINTALGSAFNTRTRSNDSELDSDYDEDGGGATCRAQLSAPPKQNKRHAPPPSGTSRQEQPRAAVVPGPDDTADELLMNGTLIGRVTKACQGKMTAEQVQRLFHETGISDVEELQEVIKIREFFTDASVGLKPAAALACMKRINDEFRMDFQRYQGNVR